MLHAMSSAAYFSFPLMAAIDFISSEVSANPSAPVRLLVILDGFVDCRQHSHTRRMYFSSQLYDCVLQMAPP